MVQCKLLRFTYNSVRYGNQRSDRRAIEISSNGVCVCVCVCVCKEDKSQIFFQSKGQTQTHWQYNAWLLYPIWI